MSRLPIVDAARGGPSARPGSALPTVVALEALWQQVARRPLWAHPNFFRYVKLRWQMRLRRLRPATVPHRGSLGRVNDCRACTDLCCVGPRATVLLRLKDLAMLQDIGRCDLIETRKPHFDRATLAARPALRRQVASMAWATFPVLRQDSMGACAALSKAGKCTLYPHWPLVCARFPYALDAEAPETFYSPRCQSFWVHPEAAPRGATMAEAAVLAYNERIVDAILLAYAPAALQRLGLLRHLQKV